MEKLDENYIEFDNLVQADSSVAGKSEPVRAQKKVNGKMYAQENASGELYQPADLNEVIARAEESAERFLHMFTNKK